MHFLKKLLFCFLLVQTGLATAQTGPPQLIVDPKGHAAMIKDVLFTPDGKTLISVSDDKTIRLWDTENGALRKTIRLSVGQGPMGKINAAALSPNGELLAVGGYFPSDEIRMVHLPTGQQIAAIKGHQNVITDLDFSGDGRLLVSASGDQTVKVWQVPSIVAGSFAQPPTVLGTLEGHTAPVYGVAISQNGRKVVSASFDGTLRLQYLDVNGLPQGTAKVMKRHQDRVYCVDISPDGQFIASGGMDGNIYLWDSDGNFYNIIKKLGQEIFTLSFSNDMNKLVAMTTFGTVYEVPFGLTLGKFYKHDNTVRASAFAPVRLRDGSEVIATAGGTNNEIFIWNAETGEVLQNMKGEGRPVWTVAFGKGNEIAFGQLAANEAGGEKKLQKVFSFDEMKLKLAPPSEQQFKGARHRYGGFQLRQRGDLTLQIGNKAQITNDATTGRTIRSYTFTADGEVIVGSAGSLRMYSFQGEFIREFVGHTGEVWDVAVSDDGRYLVSASQDQTIRLWDIATGQQMATLFVTVGNEWICWTPQGYYAASAGGEQYVGWHLDRGPEQTAEYFPAQNFREQFMRPEFVKLAVQLGNFEEAATAYLKATGQPISLSYQDPVADFTPPKVSWLIPSTLFAETTERTVRVRAKVTSETPITEVKLLVNGRPMGKERGFRVDNADTPTQKWVDFEVPLTDRETKIQVYAANEEANTTSEERIIRYKTITTAGGQAADEAEELSFDALDFLVKPNLYLLSIGVSDYENADYNLNYADDDAKAVVQMYGKRHEQVFERVYSKLLTDEKATRAQILDGFRWLEQNAGPQDVVVIFIASHGLNDQGDFYILPHDGSTKDLAATAISWEAFAQVLGSMSSKVLLFLDACHSGQMGENMADVNNTEALRLMSSDNKGVVIMSASTGDESSFEHPDWGHGAFTYALLEGIDRGYADLKPDRVIYLRELDFFVADKVFEMTNGRQNPTTQKPSTISTFPVASVGGM